MAQSDIETGSITALLKRIDAGESDAKEELFRLIYEQLKPLARKQLGGQPNRDLLQTTVVVNEACMRMADEGLRVSPKDRKQLFAAANRAMQWTLIDYARKRKAEKRTRDEDELINRTIQLYERAAGADYLDLHEALELLCDGHPRVAEVVQYKFYGQMTNSEVADALGVSLDTVKRDWRFGRAFLHSRLRGGDHSE